MFKRITNNFLHTFLTMSLVIGTQAGRADDTEIYFSSGSSSSSSSTAIRPNVLFILDTSGSMGNTLSGDPDNRSRIVVLREAMAEIINTIQNVNLGLMRFTKHEGGPVLFPITYIDETVDNVVSEVSGTEFTYETTAAEDAEEDILIGSPTLGTVTTNNASGLILSKTAFVPATTILVGGSDTTITLQVEHDDDDAEEETDDNSNNMSDNGWGLDDDQLEVDPDSMIGLRFLFTASTGTLDDCTGIADARLRMRAERTDAGSLRALIYGQDSDTTTRFSETHQGLSSRPDTSAEVEWNVPSMNSNQYIDTDDGSLNTTTELKDVIEEVVMRNCSTEGASDGTWDGNSIVLFLEHISDSGCCSRDRNWRSHDDSNNSAPRLHITTSVAGTPTPVAAIPATERLIALRFSDIDIPQGTDVTSASLSFTPTVDATGSNTWRIYGEDVDNSTAFSTTTSHLSGRKTANSTSAYAEWTVPNWVEDDEISTTDTNSSQTLEDVLQEIVNRPNWCGGNDITLFIEAQSDNALRYATSLESGTGATLNYGYETSVTQGCSNDTTNKQLEVSQDDAQQDGTNALADVNENSIPIAIQTSGFRFSDMAIPNSATIISASIEFTSALAVTGSTNVTIKGETPTDGDADEFLYALDNISDRLSSATGNSATWSLPAALSNNQTFSTPELKDIVQEIVNETNWASGNSMAFILQPNSTGTHFVWARDGSASKSPKLSIEYETTGLNITKTAREAMIELVEALPNSDATPILDVLYEAAHYWRGESVEFGKSRESSSSATLSHPGSYCSFTATPGVYDCNGATLDSSTNEFGIDLETGCDYETEWNTNACNGSFIKGSPDYISPFDTASTCQANYQIFLTDGEVYDSDNESATEIKSEYTTTCLANNSTFKNDGEDDLTYNTAAVRHTELCAVDLVNYLNTVDQIADTILDNDQTVQTSTVAFDLSGSSAQLMRDIANKGGGEFYAASSATGLATIFQSFLESVRDVPTSFVAPSLATNAFNRLLSRDEVYFGLFTPELDKRWNGNIKKYNICVDTDDFGGCSLGEIIDADANSAIDATTLRFDDEARSVWTASGTDDGGETTVGGAGAEITTFNGTDGMTIFTEIGGNSAGGTLITAGTSLDTAGYVYEETSATSDNWAADDLQAVRALVCNPAPPSPVSLAHADSPDCEARMKWLLGQKILTDPESDINTSQRWTVTDVLHSSPVVITYGGADTSTPADNIIDIFYDKLIYGTNDGALHMINGSDGTEDWRFIPNELMTQQRDMYDNPEGEHLYGMDVTPTVLVVDHNSNGIIERPDSDGNNDVIYAYVAMRRGGNNIYALDLSAEMGSATTSVPPKYLWKIEGGTGDFSRLGQTWSKPVQSTITTTTGNLEVLIFGGGYDDRLDNEADFGTEATSGDNKGNSIYIVNALTGAKVLSIAGNSTAGTDADIEVANMKFSIPSRISVLDTNGDGLDDRLYVGDTAGQVWRVDLGNDVLATGGVTAAATCQSDTTCNQTIIGRLASVSDTTDVEDERRFFEPPSVVQVLDTEFAQGIGGEYDYVLIGSGYRAHPLNEDVEDRFYAFRDVHINGMTAQTGLNLAADYPKLVAAGTEGSPIGHTVANELIDVTNQTLEDAETAMIDVDNSLGWYYDFNLGNTILGVLSEPGEKVLSAPISVAGTVFFTTYLPTENNTSADVCVGAQIGSGKAYNFDILSTKASVDWDGDGDVDVADRGLSLGGGIPSDVVPVFTKEGVVGIVGIEGGATQLGTLSGLPRFRTYWYEE